MIINGRRALAYTARIDSVTPLDGYDRVEYAHIGGWGVIVSKADGFKSGDLCIYIETDSLCPKEDERFAFLEKRKYKVKIQKMCKVYSQGLIMPLSMFPEIKDAEEGVDVTDILGITYYVPEDNKRKAEYDPYKAMACRHPKVFRKKPVRWLMRRNWGKKILYVFFGRGSKEKENTDKFPAHFAYVSKTDEERIENLPHLLEYGEPFCVTEKLDGTSSTYILEKKKRGKYEFYVCSRNVRMKTDTQESFHNDKGKDNVYWANAKKYGIENHLREYLNANNLDYVCIQGESVGPGLQGNPLKLENVDLYCFNFIRSDSGRLPSIEGKAIVEGWGMKWVPILDTEYHMPNAGGNKDSLGAMEEFKLYADGKSKVNKDVLREGVVLRNGDLSFKNVSREYMKRHG